jgi:hypothetical protein
MHRQSIFHLRGKIHGVVSQWGVSQIGFLAGQGNAHTNAEAAGLHGDVQYHPKYNPL